MEENLDDYLEYFLRDGDDVYIRRDFKDRLSEFKGSGIKNLLGMVMGKTYREKQVYTKAFRLGKEVRKVSSYQKQPIPNDLRWAVWERDNFTCRDCGTRKNLTIDHIYPESRGGELTMENAQTLCKSCNSKKGVKCQNKP